MQGVDRTRRVGELIRREMATIIAHQLPGPSLGILSITAVSVSKNLRFARIYITALSPAIGETQVAAFLNEHASQLRWALGQKVSLRRTPEIVFEYDASIERGSRISSLLEGLQETRNNEDGS